MGSTVQWINTENTEKMPPLSDIITTGQNQNTRQMQRKIDKQEATNILPSSRPKRYYWTNLAGVAFGVLCIITGNSVFFFIQSSLHSKGGLGSMALAVDYMAQVLTCFFLPPLLMRAVGCKWTLVFSGVAAAIFIVANLSSSFAILLPAAAVLGIGYATMWATMNTVVSDLAVGYAKLIGESDSVTLSKFFSMFFVVANQASIWSNIIASSILSPQVLFTDDNSTTVYQSTCGAQYCDMDEISSSNATTRKEVPYSEVIKLVIASVSIVGLGILILIVLLYTYKPEAREEEGSAMDRLLATIKLHRDPNLLLLIICTFNAGLMFSFNSADFTKAFVTCSIGIHNVGWVVSSFGIAMAVSTGTLVFMAPYLPRIGLFLGAIVLNIGDLILMLYWTPNPQTPYVFYIVSAVWGVTFSVWISQLCALYGDVFPGSHREAYSNHRTWDCFGFVVGFAWSHYICMYIKIYIIIGFLIAGAIGYVMVERRLAKSRQMLPDDPNLANLSKRRMSAPLVY